MTHENDHQNRPRDEEVRDALSEGALLRAAADDDFTSDQEHAFEDRTPAAEDERRVGFERDLRAAVGRVMSADSAPADLRDRILAALDESDAEAAVVTAADGDTRQTDYWSSRSVVGTIARWGAVAAVLAICATLIFNASRSSFHSPYTPDQAVQLAGFINSQHDQCASFGSYFDRKMKVQSIESARQAVAEILGADANAFDFEAVLVNDGDFSFAGLGPCGVPGGDASVHLMYRHPASGGSVSLFVQSGVSPDLRLPKTCCLVKRQKSEAPPELATWQADELRYYLFSHDADAMAAALKAFKAPDARHDLINID